MKTIVVCGSMKFKQAIINVKEKLESRGYVALLPTECIEGKPKTIASRAHFDRIKDDKTDAILVMNLDKENAKNYIGPNTFAEIAFAFYFEKKIILLNDIYEPFEDELIGWNAITLQNKLDNIERYL